MYYSATSYFFEIFVNNNDNNYNKNVIVMVMEYYFTMKIIGKKS